MRALLQLESSFLLFAAVRALGKTIDVVSIGRQFRKNMQFEYGNNDRLLDIRDEMHKYGNVVYMLLPCHAQLDWASPSRESLVKILFLQLW